MDKALLFKPSTPEEDVEIPGRGTVRVRGFTRAELHEMTKRPNWDTDAAGAERTMLATAMLDPVLTEDEAGMWQEAATAGELKGIIEVIGRLSGLNEGAVKSVLPGV